MDVIHGSKCRRAMTDFDDDAPGGLEYQSVDLRVELMMTAFASHGNNLRFQSIIYIHVSLRATLARSPLVLTRSF